MGWVSVKDRLPDKKGKYNVKTLEGSINPKEHQRIMLFRIYETGGRFLSFDWTTVTHWFDDEHPGLLPN